MIRSVIIRLSDYLFVLRPALLVPVWTIYLRGAAARSEHVPAATDPATIAVLIMHLLLFGGVYVLNQVYDLDTDRVNDKGHILTRGIIQPKTARYMHLLLSLLGLGLAWWQSYRMFALALVIVVLGIAYSAPPWRLKDRPFPALAVNALAHGSIVFLSGWFLGTTGWIAGLVASLPYLFAVGAVYILTTVPDTAGDREVGKRTLAVHMGPERAARWALGWYWAALLSGLYTVDVVFVFAALPTAPLYWRAAGGDPVRARRAILWSVGLLSLAAGFHYPWYLGLLGAGWLAARIYYRRRLGVSFP